MPKDDRIQKPAPVLENLFGSDELFVWQSIPELAGNAYYPLNVANPKRQIKKSFLDRKDTHLFELIPFTTSLKDKAAILATVNDNFRFTAIFDDAIELPIDLNVGDLIQIYSGTYNDGQKRMLLPITVPKNRVMDGMIWFARSGADLGQHKIVFVIEDKNTGQKIERVKYYENVDG